MLYAITYELEGLIGPGGAVSARHDEILEKAVHISKLALNILGDHVNFVRWVDLYENPIEINKLFASEDTEELENQISQINEELHSNRQGYICMWKYQDIFQLITEQDVNSWSSQRLKEMIKNLNIDYRLVVAEISEEWENT